eukprot:3927406-Prymnesium_polylepis.1
MIHENDFERGGCPFSLFFTTTPKDLINSGLYHALASPAFPVPHRELSLVLAAKGLRSMLHDMLPAAVESERRQRSSASTESGQ